MIFDLSILPPNTNPKTKQACLRFNLNSGNASALWKGNKAKRRAGIGVADSTQTHPMGMGAGEISKMLNTPL